VVADLYCGTGTLGMEALSRGAGRCFFAERDHFVASLLRRNIQTLAAGESCVVWEGDLTARLARRLEESAARIDIAFVDPPFPDARRWSWPRVVEEIFDPLARHLAEDGVVALRLPNGVEATPSLGPLVLAREKQYGGMVVLLLERAHL
jgi:16S rRNA G966 N2-methylase RsmD